MFQAGMVAELGQAYEVPMKRRVGSDHRLNEAVTPEQVSQGASDRRNAKASSCYDFVRSDVARVTRRPAAERQVGGTVTSMGSAKRDSMLWSQAAVRPQKGVPAGSRRATAASFSDGESRRPTHA